MKMNMFETLDIGSNCTMQRVPGGWVHSQSMISFSNKPTTLTSCFIPIINVAHDKLMM